MSAKDPGKPCKAAADQEGFSRYKRLSAIASLVPRCTVAADVGTDHGVLPILLIENGTADRVIGTDVRKGPLSAAEKRVKACGLEDRIELRLGDGLRVLRPCEAETIVISGMGGKLIVNILGDSPETALSARTLVLSPHRDARDVRNFLISHGFRIEDETMEEEDGKFYPIIRAVCGESGYLSEQELEYGPVLLAKRPDAFLRFLDEKREKLTALSEKLEKAGTEKSERSLRNVRSELLNLPR